MKVKAVLHLLILAAYVALLTACGSFQSPAAAPYETKTTKSPQPVGSSEPQSQSQPPQDTSRQSKPSPTDLATVESVLSEHCAPAVKDRQEPQTKQIVEVKKVIKTQLAVVGEVEYVTFAKQDLRLKARVDTGAQTTSLGVESKQLFERDGDRWVKFVIKDRATLKRYEFKKPLKRKAKIKQHDDKAEKRAVVQMSLTIGDLTRKVDVTLSNRDKFKYPVLIGRNFLDGEAVVDVSSRYLTLDSQ